MRRTISLNLYFLVLITLIVLPPLLVRTKSATGTSRIAKQTIETTDSQNQMIDGEAVLVTLEKLSEEERQAQRISSLPGADSCSAATILAIPTDGLAGGETLVNSMSSDPLDPELSCSWGTPNRPQGYRTIWYKVTAPTSGRLIVRTVSNFDWRDNYDTIVAIYDAGIGNSCPASTDFPVACSDDAHGFLSRAETNVTQGQTYYIEIADRSFGVSSNAVASMETWIEPLDSNWETKTHPTPSRSRHNVAVVGDHLIITGGQTILGDLPTRTSSTILYNTVNGDWREMATSAESQLTRPGPDGLGYSNTDMAKVGNALYLPSGWVGDQTLYDGTHWKFDIGAEKWSTLTSNQFWAANPFGYVATAETSNGYYATGGVIGSFFSTSALSQNTVYFYNVGTDSWSAPIPFFSQKRYAHTAAVYNGQPCVAGGLTESTSIGGSPVVQALSSVECYDGTVWVAQSSLNTPRYNYDGQVGPDGRWYVWGGTTIDGSGNEVSLSTIEVFDGTNWQLMDNSFELPQPARAWARGGFVGEALWITGGHEDVGTNGATENLLPQTMRLTGMLDYPLKLYFPITFKEYTLPTPTGATVADAIGIGVNQTVKANFDDHEDFYDWYYIDASAGIHTVTLDDIPTGADYNVYIYDANKTKRHVFGGDNLGTLDEEFEVSLANGRYFILVFRASPTNFSVTGDYELKITQ